MSLWEKWEREKLKKMGIKVESDSDVKILDTHPKANLRKQTWIVAAALAACFFIIYLVIAFSTSRRWSESYIVRLFIERNAQRAVQQEAASQAETP